MWQLLKHLIAGNVQRDTTSKKIIDPTKKASHLAQADGLRANLLGQSIAPEINHIFAKFPNINSAMLLVAQYWSDEANDAVHREIIYSELETPDLAAAANVGYEQEDCINRPNINSEFFLQK